MISLLSNLMSPFFYDDVGFKNDMPIRRYRVQLALK
uniref:Uncharacterized protein n=1 Tax=Anguilla anguilla TaxID=7936 RepID=A0A0E9UTU0_ANGAN